MFSVFRRFQSLSRADRRLIVRAALWLGLIRSGLLLVPFRTLLSWAETVRGQAGADEDGVVVGRIAWAVVVASRYVPGGGSCLPRALAAAIMLKKTGLPADLRIGIGRGAGGRTEAHAWVESGGRVVIGGEELEHYTLITALKEAGE